MEAEWNRGELTGFVIQFLAWILKSYDDMLTLLAKKKAQLAKYEAVLDQKTVGGCVAACLVSDAFALLYVVWV